MTDKILIIAAVIIIAGAGILIYNEFTGPVSTESDGIPIDITLDPVQTDDNSTMLPPMELGGNKYFFTVKAHYLHKGRLVSTRRYIQGYAHDVSPMDYATVWGKVPDYLPYLKFNQIVRFCLFTYKSDSPIDKAYVSSHMANNHMIPSTPNIRKALKVGKKDDLVEIEGYLVYVMGNLKNRGTTNWNSSLTRMDTGNGACEIIYVTRLRINDKVYE